MRRSTIADVCDALVDLCSKTDVGDAVDSLTVFDSTPTDQPPDDYLVIGYDDDEELPPITGGRGGGSLAKGDDAEDYDVLCLLTTWTGDSDIRPVRRQLIDYLDAVEARIENTSNLGLTAVARARVNEFSLAQPVTSEGATATLRFTVHIEAWRRP